MNILVGYITRAGYTRRVANAIAQRLREHGHETDVADLELCIRRPERYDAVVLGCGTRRGQPVLAMVRFILRNCRALETRPTAYFSVDGRRDARGHLDAWFRDIAWRPTCSITLPGVRGAWIRRAIAWLQDRVEASVRRVEAPTDWDRIRAFADDIGKLVATPSPRTTSASHVEARP